MVDAAAGGEVPVRPGMVTVIQSARSDLGFSPHIHALASLWTSANASVPITMPEGATVLATTNGRSAVALVEVGQGEVLALSDLAILGDGWGENHNHRFWENLAAWAAR